jgi:hypothetical protein
MQAFATRDSASEGKRQQLNQDLGRYAHTDDKHDVMPKKKKDGKKRGRRPHALRQRQIRGCPLYALDTEQKTQKKKKKNACMRDSEGCRAVRLKKKSYC